MSRLCSRGSSVWRSIAYLKNWRDFCFTGLLNQGRNGRLSSWCCKAVNSDTVRAEGKHVGPCAKLCLFTLLCRDRLSERGSTNSKSSSEFIKWFKIQITQRCGPLSARQSDQKKGATLLQNKLLYCHTNMIQILLVQKMGGSRGLDFSWLVLGPISTSYPISAPFRCLLSVWENSSLSPCVRYFSTIGFIPPVLTPPVSM